MPSILDGEIFYDMERPNMRECKVKIVIVERKGLEVLVRMRLTLLPKGKYNDAAS